MALAKIDPQALLGQAVDSPLLGVNEEKKAAQSSDWCNPRIIHTVSLSLFLLLVCT